MLLLGVMGGAYWYLLKVSTRPIFTTPRRVIVVTLAFAEPVLQDTRNIKLWFPHAISNNETNRRIRPKWHASNKLLNVGLTAWRLAILNASLRLETIIPLKYLHAT